jgi:diguanylate cyclase (GGDEF)-like protein
MEIVRFDDLAIRWGGEEFLILLRKTDKPFLFFFSERLRKKVESTKFRLANGKEISKTCSIGFVSFPFSPEFPRAFNCEQAITIADQALYYAKNHGRNMSVGISIKENIKLDETAAKTILNSFDKAISENYIKLLLK